MSVVVLEPPAPRTGRASRLTTEDIEALADGIKEGRFVGDNEQVGKRSAAYQRAQSAALLIQERFGIELIKIKKRVWPVEPDNLEGPWLWALGPVAPGERRRKPKASSPVSA